MDDDMRLVSKAAQRYQCGVKAFLIWYGVSIFVLWIFHQVRKWAMSNKLNNTGRYSWLDRLERRLAQRKHEPSLTADILVAGLGFIFMYVSTLSIPADSEWDRYDFVIAGFVCIGFSLLIIFSLGANIAISPQWSRSYPLIAIYFASVTMIFAKLYVLLGMVDKNQPTADYGTAVYLSMITFANLGSGDVVPSVESRFVAVTESLIGYAALAFLAALLFTTMQRGMRAQMKAYNRRRRALLENTVSTSASAG